MKTPYDLRLYPRSAAILRHEVRRSNFLEYAEGNVGTLLPLAPSSTKKSRP